MAVNGNKFCFLKYELHALVWVSDLVRYLHQMENKDILLPPSDFDLIGSVKFK